MARSGQGRCGGGVEMVCQPWSLEPGACSPELELEPAAWSSFWVSHPPYPQLEGI